MWNDACYMCVVRVALHAVRLGDQIASSTDQDYLDGTQHTRHRVSDLLSFSAVIPFSKAYHERFDLRPVRAVRIRQPVFRASTALVMAGACPSKLRGVCDVSYNAKHSDQRSLAPAVTLRCVLMSPGSARKLRAVYWRGLPLL